MGRLLQGARPYRTLLEEAEELRFALSDQALGNTRSLRPGDQEVVRRQHRDEVPAPLAAHRDLGRPALGSRQVVHVRPLAGVPLIGWLPEPRQLRPVTHPHPPAPVARDALPYLVTQRPWSDIMGS